MALPMVSVHGTFVDNGYPAQGNLIFTDDLFAVGSEDGTVYTPIEVTAILDQTGTFWCDLPLNSSAHSSPSPRLYHCKVNVGGNQREFDFVLNPSATTVDFVDLAPVNDPIPAGEAYVATIAGMSGHITAQELYDQVQILDPEAGKNAYELWLAEGNTGTMDDFFNAYGGNVGPPGPAGPQGDTGSPGPPGEVGPQGPPGQGAQGVPGPVGPTGPQGPQGVGSKWWVSSPSTPNPDSVPSPGTGDMFMYVDSGDVFRYDGNAWVYHGSIKGPEGPTGPPGPKGDKGDTGAQGPVGTVLPTGGTPNQVLTKLSSTDQDANWRDVNALPPGGWDDAVLTQEWGLGGVNLTKNPNMATNIAGWYSNSDAQWLASRDTTAPISGTASLMSVRQSGSLDDTAGSIYGSGDDAGQTPISPSTVYTIGVTFKAELANRKARVNIIWYTAAGASISTVTGNLLALPTNGPKRYTIQATSPATAAKMYLVFGVFTTSGNSTVGEKCWYDEVLIEKGSTAGTYYDGDTTDTTTDGYNWTGTANASTSEHWALKPAWGTIDALPPGGTAGQSLIIDEKLSVTNMIWNPRFAGSDLLQQSPYPTRWQGNRATWAADPTFPRHVGGPPSLKLTVTVSGGVYVGPASATTGGLMPLPAGAAHTGMVSIYPGTGAGTTYRITMYYFDAAGVALGTATVASPAITCPEGQWTDIRYTFPAMPGAVLCRCIFGTINAIPIASNFWVAEPVLTLGTYAGAYFDGSTPATPTNTYAWSGVVDASPSEQYVLDPDWGSALPAGGASGKVLTQNEVLTDTNLIANPRFMGGQLNALTPQSARWIGDRCTLAGDPAIRRHPTGPQACLATSLDETGGNNVVSGVAGVAQGAAPITGGAVYTAGTSIFPDIGNGGNWRIAIYWYDAAGGYVANSWGPTVAGPEGVWLDLTYTATAPVTATQARIYITSSTARTAGKKFWVAEPFIVPGTYTGAYFDGETLDDGDHTFAWSGTADQTPSSRYTLSPDWIDPLVITERSYATIRKTAIAQSFPTSTTQIITWEVSEVDDGIPYNSSGTFTIPVTGYYECSAATHLTTAGTVNTFRTMSVYNGSTVAATNQIGSSSSGGTSASISRTLFFTAGDQITFRASQGSGATVAQAGGTPYNWCSIVKTPTTYPSNAAVYGEQIYATSRTLGTAFSAANTTSSVVPFDAVVFEAGITTDGAGGFIVPVAGYYDVAATVTFATSNTTGVRSAFINVDGSQMASSANSPISGQVSTAVVAGVFLCAAGQKITIRAYQSSGIAVNLSTGVYTKVSISKVPAPVVPAQAASGVWGVGRLAGLGSDTTIGQPIYLDASNQLRAGVDADTGWINFSYEGDWLDYGSGYAPGGYRKVGNKVTLRGLIKTPTAKTTTSVISIIPVGFRPAYIAIFNALVTASMVSGAASTGTAHTHTASYQLPMRLDVVPTSGNVTANCQGGWSLGANGYISLEGISYYTD